jgi:hypothetical protein
MSRILAADNLIIDMQPDRWRLLVNGASEERLLLEAALGQPLRYVPAFATTRRLPEQGRLPVEHIRRVILGWSQEDGSWHLGFLLEPELAQERGSRWCEIAYWSDPQAFQYEDVATQAGEMLAQAIARPFNIIQPRESERPAPARPLPSLPLEFDLWSLDRVASNQFQLIRSPRWSRKLTLRAVWYSVLALVYIGLVVTSLTSGIALPRPELVLYLGAASAILLVGMVFYMVYQLLTSPNRIVIDTQRRSVRAFAQQKEQWAFADDQIQSVYVTHVLNKPGKNPKDKKRHVYYGELNLHLTNDQFCRLYEQDHASDKSDTQDQETADESTDELVPLTSDMVFTDLQAAGVYIAQALGVPCWYDRRFR